MSWNEESPSRAGFPCILPAEHGSVARDRFAPDCPLRQLVCGCRDFAAATRDPPRNSRAFAGSWERGTAETAPETASSGPIAGSWSGLALLPSLAVRTRSRFAPGGIPEVRTPFAPARQRRPETPSRTTRTLGERRRCRTQDASDSPEDRDFRTRPIAPSGPRVASAQRGLADVAPARPSPRRTGSHSAAVAPAHASSEA